MPSIPEPTSSSTETLDEYVVLRDMILREEVMPNERLIEMEYAQKLGTSRANIRKALARLEQDGLVVIEAFRGAHVRRITKIEAVEMFEVRGALEVMLIQHVAERVTEFDKKTLKAMTSAMRDALKAKDPVAVGVASRKLREELWRISGHATASKLLSSFNTQLVRTWYRTRTVPGRAEAIVEELSAVVDALCTGSTAKATKEMRRYHDAAILNLKHALEMGASLAPR